MAAGFLAVSAILALAFLAFRNIYDDEVTSLNLTGLSFRSIVHIANTEDVHPPGMYVLSHWAYLAIRSPRWIAVAPLLFYYAGLSAFAFAVAPLFAKTPSRICFLLLATLHPQLIMWSNSIRWYPWWTGIALATLVVALRPRERDAPPTLGYGRSLLVGLLLACLFYLNYITLIFTAALAAAMLLRYSWKPWRPGLAGLGLFALLIAPQLRPLVTVHMAGSHDQRSGLALSAARLAQSISASEAYLPWHPLALAAVLVFLLFGGICAWAGIGFLRAALRARSLQAARRPLPAILCFAVLFLALVALSGLGGKPRNALLLAPVLAPAAALALERIRPRAAQYALLAFYAIWSAVGMLHLIGRSGVAKAGMNNHPEEVLDFVRQSRGANCAVLVTYDPELAFIAATSRMDRLLVLSPSQNSMYRGAQPFAPAECPAIEAYVVKSYLGGLVDAPTLADEIARAEGELGKPVRVESFGFDPDASLKRRLRFVPGASDLPDYRYVVYSGSVAVADLRALRQPLAEFVPADGWSQPPPHPAAPPQ